MVCLELDEFLTTQRLHYDYRQDKVHTGKAIWLDGDGLLFFRVESALERRCCRWDVSKRISRLAEMSMMVRRGTETLKCSVLSFKKIDNASFCPVL